MEDLFTPYIKESAVDRVINSIKDLLVRRKLLPGDRLPSEQEIANQLGVSRGSVRSAMKTLSSFGIIEIKVGDGTYVSTSMKNNIIDPLLFSFLLSKPDLEELAQFRELIEINSFFAWLAATPSFRAQIKGALKRSLY